MNELIVSENEQIEEQDTRIPTLLTKAVAVAICDKIRRTGVFLDTGNRRDSKNNPVEVFTRDEEGELSPFPLLLNSTTVRSWQIRNTIIRETGEHFNDVLERARGEYAVLEEKRLKEETVATAKKFIKTVQNIPTDKSYERSEEIETEKIITDVVSGKLTTKTKLKVKDTRVNTEALKVGLDACKFVLERLDPDYMPKQHTRSEVAILTLADLRRYKNEEQGLI